jgi:acetyltransferase-like isoleucine patch superfamily enzyme
MKDILKLFCLKIYKRMSSINYNYRFDDRVSIGSFTYGLRFGTILLYSKNDRVNIGSYCSIGPGVRIISGGEHNYRLITSFPLKSYLISSESETNTFSKGTVEIGNDVWIGANAIIMSGVTIGDGVVIGAGSVFTKDIPPYAIVTGTPNKIVGYRFDQKIIKALMEIRWWSWDIETILKRLDDIYGDPAAFIKKYITLRS